MFSENTIALKPKLMTQNPNENLTQMLKEAQAGKRESLDEFLPLVYDELKKIAAYKLALERSNQLSGDRARSRSIFAFDRSAFG